MTIIVIITLVLMALVIRTQVIMALVIIMKAPDRSWRWVNAG